MNRSAYVGLALIATLLFGTPARAQQAKSKAEYDAYKAMYDEQEPQRKAQLAEAFLNDYGDSDFVPAAFQLLSNAYVGARNWRKVVETADRFDQTVPDADSTVKGFMYQRAMAAAEQGRDAAKVVEFGEKVLQVDRNNLGALLTLSTVITDNLPPDDAEKERSLGRAFQLANRARVQAQQALRSKPENLTDAQWDAQRMAVFSRIYMTLGVVHYTRGDYEQAAEEYKRVIGYNPRDPFAHLQLGLSYEYEAAGKSALVVDAVAEENEAKTNQAEQAVLDQLVARREALEGEVLGEMDLAIDSFAKAVALGGQAGNLARVELERLYRRKNDDSLDGLDELIEEKRAELGVR
jgi:lipopolysaccharide biosynthesis regulator YciM